MEDPWSSTVDDFQLWRNDASGSTFHHTTNASAAATFDDAQQRDVVARGVLHHTSHRAETGSKEAECDAGASNRAAGRAHTSNRSSENALRNGWHNLSSPDAGGQNSGTKPLELLKKQAVGSRSFGFDNDRLLKTCLPTGITKTYVRSSATQKRTVKDGSDADGLQTDTKSSWRGGHQRYGTKRSWTSRGRSKKKAGNSGRGGDKKSTQPRLTSAKMTNARVTCAKQPNSDQSVLSFAPIVDDDDDIETISIRKGNAVYHKVESGDYGQYDNAKQLSTSPRKTSDSFCEGNTSKPLFRGTRTSSSFMTSFQRSDNDMHDGEDERRVALYGELFKADDESEHTRMQMQVNAFKSGVQGWGTLPAARPSEAERLPGGQDTTSADVPALGAASKNRDGRVGSARLGVRAIPLLESSDRDSQAGCSSLFASRSDHQPNSTSRSLTQWLSSTQRSSFPTQRYSQGGTSDLVVLPDSSSSSVVSWDDPSEVYADLPTDD